MDEILQVHHISRSYMDKNHPFRAVEDVSFSLHAGEMLGIVGLSGSGKSTVLRMAGALEEPEKGNIQRPWARDSAALGKGQRFLSPHPDGLPGPPGSLQPPDDDS